MIRRRKENNSLEVVMPVTPDLTMTSFLINDDQDYKPSYIPLKEVSVYYINVTSHSIEFLFYIKLDHSRLPTIRLSSTKLSQIYTSLIMERMVNMQNYKPDSVCAGVFVRPNLDYDTCFAFQYKTEEVLNSKTVVGILNYIFSELFDLKIEDSFFPFES